jgi:hypothetical protein
VRKVGSTCKSQVSANPIEFTHARRVSGRACVGRPQLEQNVLLTADEQNSAYPTLYARGTLDRPTFAEITEVSPPEPTWATTSLSADASVLRIDAPALPAHAEIRVAGSARLWQIAGNEASLVIPRVDGESELELTIVCSLRETQS